MMLRFKGLCPANSSMGAAIAKGFIATARYRQSNMGDAIAKGYIATARYHHSKSLELRFMGLAPRTRATNRCKSSPQMNKDKFFQHIWSVSYFSVLSFGFLSFYIEISPSSKI